LERILVDGGGVERNRRMRLDPAVGRRIWRIAKSIETTLPQSRSSLVVESDIYDPEVDWIKIAGGIDGVEDTGGMDRRFVVGRHISLVVRKLKAGRAWHLCHIARRNLRSSDRGGRRCYTWFSEAMV
jgi:hypothetical protein